MKKVTEIRRYAIKLKKPRVKMNNGIYTIMVQGDWIPFTPGKGISWRMMPINMLTRKKNAEINKESSGGESKQACQKILTRKKV
jgi:hypothetical protein